MKRPKRWMLIAGAVIALLGLLAYLVRGGGGVAVQVAAAGRDTLSVTIPVEGVTRAREQYTVAAPITGRLARLEVRAGRHGAGRPAARPLLSGAGGSACDRDRPSGRASSGGSIHGGRGPASRGGDPGAAGRARGRATPAPARARRDHAREPGAGGARGAGGRGAQTIRFAATLEAAEAALVGGARRRLLGAEASDGAVSPVDVRAPVAGRVGPRAGGERAGGAGRRRRSWCSRAWAGLEVVMDVLSEDAVRVRRR
jgi:HlyD family secretion protein